MAERTHLEDMLSRLWNWTTTYGDALCPGSRADTFGEGMREAKEQVSRLLVPARALHAASRVLDLPASSRLGNMPVSELSKRDADALGVADMTGAQLRMRVFHVEGLMCELALVVEEMLRRFAPDDDGLGEAEIMCAARAREAVASVRQRYGVPQYGLYTIQLTKREMDVAREWIAHTVTIPSDHPDADHETAESVIAKLEALGARGTLYVDTAACDEAELRRGEP